MISLREAEQMLLSTVTDERMETQKPERGFPHLTRQQKDRASPLPRTHTEGGQVATWPESGSLSRCLWALYPPLGPVGPKGKRAREGTQPGASLQLLPGHSTAYTCCPPGKRSVGGHGCYCNWNGLVSWRIEAGRAVSRCHRNSCTVVTELKFQSWPCHLLPVRLWAAHFTSLSPNSYFIKSGICTW